ncbi:uncharacterized protein LOC124374954 isoform X1 [Homalodisca vitripennis]|nr:uncharacterized protein LOC124374954 isoform X1 [Homalodisca vitripennis]
MLDLNLCCRVDINRMENPKSEIPPETLKKLFIEQINEEFSDYIKIYTDGSRNAEGSGAAVLLQGRPNHLSYKFCLPKIASSYTAELYAIKKAIEIANLQPGNKVLICSDSKAAIHAVKTACKLDYIDNITSQIVEEVLSSEKKITLQWVPGHVGITPNEIVDKLAKEAIQTGKVIKDLVLPMGDFVSHLKCEMTSLYKAEVEQSNKARWYRDVQRDLPMVPWFKNAKIGRSKLVTIIRLRLGHAQVNETLFRINCYFTEKCLKCTLNVKESLQHLIFECPTYDSFREPLIQHLKEKKVRPPFYLKELLGLNPFRSRKSPGGPQA